MPSKQAKKQPDDKSSTLAKSTPKSIEKKLSNTQLRGRILERICYPFDPDRWQTTDVERMIKNTSKELPGKANEEVTTAIMTLGFDNDYVLVGSVSKYYTGLVVELRRKLIKDFDCKTHAEKALIDMAISGYVRVIHASQYFANCLEKGSTNNNLNQFMSVMSKEIDRAHRHFTTSYQMLVQLKQPPINVHLKTQNAFVAQAQQFNMEKPTPEVEEKNISPK